MAYILGQDSSGVTPVTTADIIGSYLSPTPVVSTPFSPLTYTPSYIPSTVPSGSGILSDIANIFSGIGVGVGSAARAIQGQPYSGYPYSTSINPQTGQPYSYSYSSFSSTISQYLPMILIGAVVLIVIKMVSGRR